MSELLLQTISTLGRMRIESFDEAFDTLYQIAGISGEEVDINYIRRQTVRFLDALGHCEFDFDKRQVLACPPILVTLPLSGPPVGILTGARIPAIVEAIKDFVKSNRDSISYSIKQQKRKGLLLPPAVYIEAVNHESLNKVAQAAHIGHYLAEPAAWSLVNFSAGIEDIVKDLKYESRADINWYKRTFSMETLTFSRFHNTEKAQGLVTYINPVNQQRHHWIWEGDRAAEVDRDWGRYIILATKRIDVLLYDERHQRLVVPSTIPLPRFLARAATLCTGLAPVPAGIGEKPVGGLPAGHPVDIYCAVPQPIANMISEKLSQELIPYKIVINSDGVIS